MLSQLITTKLTSGCSLESFKNTASSPVRRWAANPPTSFIWDNYTPVFEAAEGSRELWNSILDSETPKVAQVMLTRSVLLSHLALFVVSADLPVLVLGQTLTVQQCKNVSTSSPSVRNLSMVTAMHTAGISIEALAGALMC